MSTVYTINKGINKPAEFNGLKAQYIWYLGSGLVALLVLFAVLYISGVNTFICLGLIVLMGTALFVYIYHLSHTYGQHGLMKKMARRYTPKTIRSNTRRTFTRFGKQSAGTSWKKH